MGRFIDKIKSHKLFVVCCALLAALLIYWNYEYFLRIGAFGCFDDCFNYTIGHFILMGRKMYSEIFYNHNMGMPYISAFIQYLFKPDSLYSLLVYHRLFIQIFSVFMIALLVIRFKWVGILFALLYEPVKFYYFGDRFLPESMIAYLLAYLLGIAWLKLTDKKLLTIDYYACAIFTFLVFVLREPYIPVSLLLFVYITIRKPIKTSHWKSIILFLSLVGIILLTHSIPDYIYQVFTVNIKGVAGNEVQTNKIFGTGALQIIFYPLFILYVGVKSYLRSILISYDILFLILSLLVIYFNRKLKPILFILLVLALAGIRTVVPGTMYYQTFHMTPWFGLFVMSIACMSVFVLTNNKFKKLGYTVVLLIFGISIITTFSHRSFMSESIDRLEEFSTGYSKYQQYGNYINALKEPRDLLFVDELDEILYWLTGLNSSYRYGLYTPWDKGFDIFEKAKTEMYNNNPPDIYYCSSFNEKIKDYGYIQLQHNGEPICLFLSKQKAMRLSKEQLENMKAGGLTLINNP